MKDDYTFHTSNGEIYLTDVFRIHEAIDEDQGAAGILGYITRLIEQVVIVHIIRFIFQYQPKLLNEFLFIVDGPLSFSGQTANMNNSMRNLCNFLIKKRDLFLVGIEKSGPLLTMHMRSRCLQMVSLYLKLVILCF